ncbi:hypothetical protein [Microbulbifer taiwanensis]|uniref:hypothetical protein n=1 Tax=Microbulbifer taiwanensis TaxID=986746 RepID=UPI00360CF0DB
MTDLHNNQPRRSALRSLRKRFSSGLAALGMGLLIGGAPIAAVADDDQIQLPELGDSSSGLVSRAREKELGQMWLRMFRSQVRTSNDALLQQYVENTVKGLSEFSPWKTRLSMW